MDCSALGSGTGICRVFAISSSGHLALLQNLLDFHKYGVDHIVFDVVLHMGTLVAVVVAFWKDIKMLIREFVGMALDGFKVKKRPGRRMVVMLIIATLPLVIAALLENAISNAFQNTLFIGCALLFTAAMLVTANRIGQHGTKTEKNASYLDALKVGFMQLLAVLPGISRSGSTICGGLFSGFKRDFAVRFAFIMSIPAVLGAVVFKLPDMFGGSIRSEELLAYGVGFVVSAVCGYLAICLVRTLMKKNSFQYFAIYCAVVGAISIIFSLV